MCISTELQRMSKEGFNELDLLVLLGGCRSDAEKSIVYFNLASISFSKKDYASCIKYSKENLNFTTTAAKQNEEVTLCLIKQSVNNIVVQNQENFKLCKNLLIDCLAVSSCELDDTLHYNLGLIYQRNRKFDKSLLHFKIALSQSKTVETSIKCYISISLVLRTLKRFKEAENLLLKAKDEYAFDPDINNNYAIVLTELNKLESALECYTLALSNCDNSRISNSNLLRQEITLNFGSYYSNVGDNMKSIMYYNDCLKLNKNYLLAYQNKLMSLLYVQDQINNDYVTTSHDQINLFFNKNNKNTTTYASANKNVIGFVSGDFGFHPVSFFVSGLIKGLANFFKVKIYSENVITKETKKYFGLTDDDIYYTKYRKAEEVAEKIIKDKVYTLFDLSGHSYGNRLDVFACKPAPVQISYCGYPCHPGLKQIDYILLDDYMIGTIKPNKVLSVPGCFLNYNLNYIAHLIPEIKNTNKTDKVVACCFNRLEKISESCIKLFNKLLLANENLHLLFKNKAFCSIDATNRFLSKFDKSLSNRIQIKPPTETFTEHLACYNEADVAFDTLPYSGTTTSCEALVMGVPVFTFPGKTLQQNVTKSILVNSGLSEYVINLTDLQRKAYVLPELKVNKHSIAEKFKKGNVCNTVDFVEKIKNKIENIIENTVLQ